MSNKLEIQIDNIRIVDFEYYTRVNEISGSQGRGKTKLVNDISDILKVHSNNQWCNIKQNIDLSKVDVISEEKVSEHNFQKWESGGYILFIDNYDRCYNEQIAEFIGKSKNTFFLISRKYGLQFQQMYGENMLDYDGTTYRLINMKYNPREYDKIYWGRK